MPDDRQITETFDEIVGVVTQFAEDATADDLATLREMHAKVDSLRSTLEDRIEAVEAS